MVLWSFPLRGAESAWQDPEPQPESSIQTGFKLWDGGSVSLLLHWLKLKHLKVWRYHFISQAYITPGSVVSPEWPWAGRALGSRWSWPECESIPESGHTTGQSTRPTMQKNSKMSETVFHLPLSCATTFSAKIYRDHKISLISVLAFPLSQKNVDWQLSLSCYFRPLNLCPHLWFGGGGPLMVIFVLISGKIEKHPPKQKSANTKIKKRFSLIIRLSLALLSCKPSAEFRHLWIINKGDS